MNYREFVKSSVLNMGQETYDALKKALVGEFISFSIINESQLTKEILAEKLCDYFEKLELKTGKSFDKHIDAYINNIDNLVEPKIAETPQPKKKDDTPIVVPRVRKYYDHAMCIKNSRVISEKQLLEFIRIMMCLYSAIIKNNGKKIDNFDFSASCINADSIITSMKNEQDIILKLKRPMFNIKDLYCSDTFTFIVTIIALFKIADEKITGEYYHE